MVGENIGEFGKSPITNILPSYQLSVLNPNSPNSYFPTDPSLPIHQYFLIALYVTFIAYKH